MRDLILLGLGPYLAAILLIVVPAWRCLSSRARRAAFPELCRESARLYRTSPVWRWSLALVLLAHGIAFLSPHLLAEWNRSPARLLFMEAAGLACGAAALIGLDRLVRGRTGSGEAASTRLWPPADILLLALAALTLVSGVLAAALFRWGSQWYAVSLLPWFHSLAALHPDVSYVAPLPPLVKLHVLAGIGLTAVLPFTRAFYALAWPAVRAAERVRAWSRSRPVRAASVAAEIGLVMLCGLLFMGALRRIGVSEGYAPAQPIAFSHEIHAGNNRIPCLYCHFAAEKSRHAGIPPAGVCLNCHDHLRVASAEVEKLKEAVAQRRPLRWIKIHNLPDFVFFSHRQHVRGGRVACQSCHGPVETMARVAQAAPLTMGWCLDCHRREGVLLAPQLAAGRRAHPATGGLDCGKCHY
jgi:nitrate reductase gamma subunit